MLPALAQGQSSARNVKWGVSRRDVITSEGKEPKYLTEISLTYDSVLVGNYPIRHTYDFKDNKLVSTNYTANALLADSLKLKAAFLQLVKDAIVDIGEYHVEGTDSSPITKLTFESEQTKAIIFFGPVKATEYSLSAYYLAKPTFIKKNVSPKKRRRE